MSTGVRRIELRPGKRSTPAHAHTAEEEIFYVLGGTGLSRQDGAVFEIGAGGSLVHLPRAGVFWLGPSWVTSGEGAHPWGGEMAAGELECPAPSVRPARISTVGEVAPREAGQGGFQLSMRDLARAAGSRDIGLRHVHLAAGMLSYPFHCHSAEEEVFVEASPTWPSVSAATTT